MIHRLFWQPDALRRLQRLGRRRPWERQSPVAAQVAIGLKGMLGPRESLLYFYLTCDVFSGRGVVVDAGSFLGKSASLFAAGLRGNPVAGAKASKVHCFDNFIVNERGTVAFIKSQYSCSVAIGDSTRQFFDDQVEPVREMLEVHAGDFLRTCWSAGPIEILMVDIAKSQQLWSRVLSKMFPSLVPGVSIVIHQDYHHTWLPHIHIVMEFLHPYFELVLPRVDDSAVFLLRRSLPEHALDRAVRYDFTAQERLALMDAAITRLPPKDQLFVRLAKVVLRARDGANPAELNSEFEAIKKTYGIDDLARNAAYEEVRTRLLEFPEQIAKESGWCALKKSEWSVAVDIAKRLLVKREDGDALLMLGYGLLGLGRYQEAEGALRRASARDTSAAAYIPAALARAVLHQERHDEAEQILLEFLERIGTSEADISVNTKTMEAMQELFAARPDPEKNRKPLELLRRLRLGEPVPCHLTNKIPP